MLFPLASMVFLPKRSTVTNLLCFLECVTANMDKGEGTDSLYLDIAKAFYTISHNKLISKLIKMNADVKLVRWLLSFLGDRQQLVNINGSFFY
jgi:hypothetical protein